MAKQSYDSIEELSGVKYLQHRASTLVGTTQHPTHLFEEVFDNALDEVLSGYATKVEVTIKNNICKISDNGRGFPVGKDPKTGEPFPVKACTKLFTSGKYNLDVKAYKKSAGTNGIGLTAVTALSDIMAIRSHRDGQCHEFTFTTDFEKGEIKHQIIQPKPSDGKGTIVLFKPSAKIYKSTEFDIDFIKERIKLCRMLTNADISLKINDEVIPIEADKSQLMEAFFEDKNDNETHTADCTVGDENIRLWFYYDFNKAEPRFKGSVNLLPIHTGTHIRYIKNIIPEVLENFLPKNSKLSKTDLLIGLRCFVATEVVEKEFSGQTKGELATDISYFDKFTTLLKIALAKVFNEEIDTQELYERFVSYKSSLEVKKATKTIKKRKFTTNLFDCAKYKDSTLFIVEGESAAGSLIKCRDRNKHAVYTLTGKSMPNVETNTASKILSNKTVADMFNVLCKDLDMKPMEDTDKVRYDYISITTDPDVDGYHISMMMLMFFNKFFPKLIEEGRIVLSIIPLYGYYDKKKFIGVYDLNEAKKMLSEGKHLMRHKGLGEFDPDELETILFKEARYTVVTKDMVEEAKKTAEENESDLIL